MYNLLLRLYFYTLIVYPDLPPVEPPYWYSLNTNTELRKVYIALEIGNETTGIFPRFQAEIEWAREIYTLPPVDWAENLPPHEFCEKMLDIAEKQGAWLEKRLDVCPSWNCQERVNYQALVNDAPRRVAVWRNLAWATDTKVSGLSRRRYLQHLLELEGPDRFFRLDWTPPARPEYFHPANLESSAP